MEESILPVEQDRMTSLQVAEITGKRHADVMRDIRKMEPAWEKVNERKFALVEYTDEKGEKRPCYSLTKTEWLYVCTKFNDEARAKLVLRWEELERERLAQLNNQSNMINQMWIKTANLLISSVMVHQGETFTTTQIANRIGKQAWEIYDELLDLGIVQRRRGGGYVFTEEYSDGKFGEHGRYFPNSNKGSAPLILWNTFGALLLERIMMAVSEETSPRDAVDAIMTVGSEIASYNIGVFQSFSKN